MNNSDPGGDCSRSTLMQKRAKLFCNQHPSLFTPLCSVM